MGHQGNTTAMPPNIRPLPSQRSQSGHLTGTGGFVDSAVDSSDMERNCKARPGS